jgi:hypothetical protein
MFVRTSVAAPRRGERRECKKGPDDEERKWTRNHNRGNRKALFSAVVVKYS